jgi:hypothetical protein
MMKNAIVDFTRILELKRYSRSTIGSYKSHLGMVKGHFKNKTFQEIRGDELFESLLVERNAQKLHNTTPSDVYNASDQKILEKRFIKAPTIKREEETLGLCVHIL